MTYKTADNQKSKNIIRALMNPSLPDELPWSSSDLRALLQHQLSAPLDAELDSLAESGGCSPQKAKEIIEGSDCRSFGEALRHKAQSPMILKMIKNYAKRALSKQTDLPRDVARVLYMLAIARGIEMGVADITTLNQASIEREITRCLTFGWLPDDIRALLRAGIRNSGRRD